MQFVVIQVDVGEEKDVSRLQKVFAICQTLMNMKYMESDVYKEENESLTKRGKTRGHTLRFTV